MEDKFAVISLTSPLDHARIFHAFLYLYDLQDSGIEAKLFLDGESVKIIEHLEKNPNDIIKPLYDKAVRDGLIKQACGFCSDVFNVKSKLENQKIPLSQEGEHISISNLIKNGYKIITV